MYLPDINYVAWLPCGSLPRQVALRAECGLPVAVTATLHPITLCKEAECTAVWNIVNRSSSQTATLKFRTSDTLAVRPDMAFVIRDTGGSTFLIGAYEHPHPLVQRTWSSGAHDGDPACWTVEVTLTARRSLISCVV